MADKELEALKRDFMRLQEICIMQEKRIHEISKDREALVEKADFFEKKELTRRDADLKLMQEFQSLEAEIVRKDDELFSLNCIKNKYDETRNVLSKYEKESIARKFEDQNHEEEILSLKNEIQELNATLAKTEKKKKEFESRFKITPAKNEEEEQNNLRKRVEELEEALKERGSASLQLSPNPVKRKLQFSGGSMEAMAEELKNANLKVEKLEKELIETRTRLMSTNTFQDSLERKCDLAKSESKRLTQEVNMINSQIKSILDEVNIARRKARLSSTSMEDLRSSGIENVEQRMNKSALFSMDSIPLETIDELKSAISWLLQETLKSKNQNYNYSQYNHQPQVNHQEINKLRAALEIYSQEKDMLLTNVTKLESEKEMMKSDLENSSLKILELRQALEKATKPGVLPFRRIASEGKKINLKETLLQQKQYLMSLHEENMLLREKLLDLEKQLTFIKSVQRTEPVSNHARTRKLMDDIDYLDRKRFEVQSQIIRISEDLIPYNELVNKVYDLQEEYRKSKASMQGKLTTGFPTYPASYLSKPLDKKEEATLKELANENRLLQEELRFLKAKVQDITQGKMGVDVKKSYLQAESTSYSKLPQANNSTRELENVNYMLTQELEMHSKLSKLKTAEIDNLKLALMSIKKENEELRKSTSVTPSYFSSRNFTTEPSPLSMKTDRGFITEFDQKSAYGMPYTMKNSHLMDDPFYKKAPFK